MIGTVKWYNAKYGYGFIEGEDGVDIFIHKNELPFWTIFLNSGDKLEYMQEETRKGLVATNVKII